MITRAGIVVPARDERALIGDCLRSVRRAALAAPVPVAVCVVLDRCTDDTETVMRQVFPDVLAVRNRAALPLGGVRDLGARALLAEFGAVDLSSVWLLGTDADTVVGPDWVSRHLACADAGADAVAGLVELRDTAHLRPETLRTYRERVAARVRPLDHDHVYGANLGVRASAYLSVGGFAAIDTGEDRDLWHRVGAAGHHTAQPADLLVHTSARARGRATGGLAELLGDLDAAR